MLDGLTQFVAEHPWPALGAAAVGSLPLHLAGRALLRRLNLDGRSRSERRLREAIEAMPEGLAFYDAQDRIVVWNRRYAELNAESRSLLKVGASFRSLLEAGLAKGIYPEAVGREAAWLEERLAHRRTGQVVLEQPNDGHWLRIVERRTADGGVVSVCEDITELKAREASFRLMFESNPAPMWVVDRETRRFIAVNEAAISHYGYSREQFLQLSLPDLYAPEEHEKLRDHVRTHGESRYEGKRVWRQIRADGSEILARPYVQAIQYEGRPATISAQFDVTASRQAEVALAEAREKAEAASRAKGEFLANMSHEIRTPLNGVMGVAQVLARSQLDAKQREMVGIIECSARTLERLLSDILDLSRVESGRVSMEAEPFDLAEAVRATAAVSDLRAREKGVRFNLEIATAASVTVIGDVGRLKQILFNLLSNAVKFTQAGEISLRVSVEAGDPAVFTFVVDDTGVGFSSECGSRLFRRFEQEDGSITRRFGGTGLGLAISRDLAQLMGGTLEAASEIGRGSTFTLKLPLQVAEGPAEPAWEAAPAFVAEAESRPLRVLLAEDHPTNRKVVELMLATMGADLTSVEDGKAAVEAMETQAFDVVLMDMQMPVMDGLTAIRIIRERERAAGAPRTPVFILSANAMSEHEAASSVAGADRHLTKPISAPVLLTALGEVAEQVALTEAA